MHSTYKASIIVGVLGFFLWLFGVLIIALLPTVMDYMLYKELPLENDSLVYNLWKDIPIPIYQSCYFFDIENSDEFVKGANLKVTERGPYVYKSYWNKSELSFNSNDTLSYRETKTYYFVPELSVGNETDQLTTINVPLLVAGDILKDADLVVKFFASIAFGITNEKLFIRRSVGELMYKGYGDVLMEIAPLIKPSVKYMNGRFGYLYGKNATDEGLFNVYSGKTDLSRFNVIAALNGSPHLNIFNKTTCNMINGTNGELNPPRKYSFDKVQFFQTLLCRTWELSHSTSVNYKGGISAERYVIGHSVFANSSEYPDNSCYNGGHDLPYGVTGVAPCYFGAPIYISKPHFLDADESFRKEIDGLSPNETIHDFYLDIEPYTGISVGLMGKFQINVYLTPVKGIKQLAKARKIMLPIMWQNLNITYTQEYLDLLHNKVYKPIYFANIGSYLLLSVGALLFIITLSILAYNGFRGRNCTQTKPADDFLIDPAQSNGPQENGVVNPALEEGP